MDVKRKEKYLRIFAPEAQELVGAITAALLRYEDEPDPARIQEVLRRLHTLKGSARMINLNELGSLAHRLEDLFKAYGEETVGAEAIDVTFTATDHMLGAVGMKELPTDAPTGEAIERRIADLIIRVGTGTDSLDVVGEGVERAPSVVVVESVAPPSKPGVDMVSPADAKAQARTEKYLKIFAPEAKELVSAMTSALLRYEESPNAELIREVLRKLHTLKGSARMINLGEIGGLAHRLEDLFKAHGDQTIGADTIDITFETTDHILVAVGMKELPDGGSSCELLEARIEGLLARFSGAGDGEEGAKGPAAPKDKDPADQSEAFPATSGSSSVTPGSSPSKPDSPPSKPADKGPVPPNPEETDPKPSVLEARKAKYLKIFSPEAQELVSAITAALLHYEEKPDPKHVTEVLRRLHTLKGSARMINLLNLGALAHALEDLFKVCEGETIPSAVIDMTFLATDYILGAVGQKELGPDAPEYEEIEKRIDELIRGLDKSGKLARKEKPTKEGAPSTAASEPPSPAAPSKAISPKSERIPEGMKRRKQPRYPQLTGTTIRVDSEKLDKMMDLSGELLIHRTRQQDRLSKLDELVQMASKLHETGSSVSTGGALSASTEKLLDGLRHLRQRLDGDLIETGNLIEDIQYQSMDLRMLPAATIVDDFYRTVRDLSRQTKKKARLVVLGQETELDKHLLEEIKPPLIHIIRNAIDHGLESPEERLRRGKPEDGLIRLRIATQGSQAIFEIIDDGKGMDPDTIRASAVRKGLLTAEEGLRLSPRDALYLIFQPGFTTRDEVTDLSGRGVGMDVVKSNIDKLKGNISIDSMVGQFTRIVLAAPLTLAVIHALIVECSGQRFAMPLFSVSETIKFTTEDVTFDGSRDLVKVRGSLIPLVRLGDVLGRTVVSDAATPPHHRNEKLSAVVVRHREDHVALLVDQCLTDDDIVVKSLGDHLRYVPYISGATILGEGEPVLILNVHEILSADLGALSQGQPMPASAREALEPAHVMVVDDSIATRSMEKSILESAGYRVTAAASAEDALEVLLDTDPDIMVVDIEMTGMSGFDLVERLRGEANLAPLSATPVIFVSSKSAAEDIAKGMEVGAQAFLPKQQFDQDKLLDTVQAVLRTSGRRKELA